MRILFLLLFSILSGSVLAASNSADKFQESKAKNWLQNQHPAFIENKGQFTDSEGQPAENVLFKTSQGNCDIYITTKGLSYVFVKYENSGIKTVSDRKNKNSLVGNRKVSYYRLDMNLEGATIDKEHVISEQPGNQGNANFIYSHCPEGIYGVKEYGKITIKDIYKGIDWVIYANADAKDQLIKYDFVVHPNADYAEIRIKFVNARNTRLLDRETKLKIETIAGIIEEGRLYSYVSYDTENQELLSKYVKNNDSTFAFEIAPYDKSKTLVIDPLVWATYYGGSGNDWATSVCVDSQDNVYIAGGTTTTVFPTQQSAGAYWQPAGAGEFDIFLVKFDKNGVRQWATFYGGDSTDYCESLCIDSQDNILLTGETASTDFPTQQLSGAFWQQTYGGGTRDVFILKFNNQGQRQWASFYGGILGDWAFSVCTDSQDNIFITGNTDSPNFPVQQFPGAYFQSNNAGGDAFILKFNSKCSCQWATLYGGSGGQSLGNSICADGQGNIYITGVTYSANFPTQQLSGAYWQANLEGISDAILLKFDNLGIRKWASYYGGNIGDGGHTVCLDSKDNIYITGYTSSTDFPTQQLAGAYWQPNFSGAEDITILKFNSQGARQWATYYGGTEDEDGESICVDNEDNIFITGYTLSSDFPLQQKAGEYWESSFTGGHETCLLQFNEVGERQWATYYGSSSLSLGTSCASDSQNSIYFTGICVSLGAFTVDYGNGAYYDASWNGNNDAYILKIRTCTNQKTSSVQSDKNNFCQGEYSNITLSAVGGIGDTLKWYSGGCGVNYIGKNTPLIIPSPAQTTTYYARWESLCDTSACDSITVNINPAVGSMWNPIICTGDSVSVGTNFYSITGTYSDTIPTLPGCDSIITTNLTVLPGNLSALAPQICQGQSFSVGSHLYLTTGIYIDTLISVGGCDSIITTNLTVNPVSDFFQNPKICQGESFAVGIHNYNTSGVFSDTLTSVWNCDSIVTTNLTVNPNPVISLGNDTILCPGDKIVLSPGSGFSQYVWSDGTIENSLTVSLPGIYSVWVSDGLCSSTDSIILTNCGSVLWLPNAFTPNGDALNNRFKPVISGILNSYYILIYNRWGQQIYESNDPDVGWDGTFEGTLCPNGLYVFYISYSIGTDGSEVVRKVTRGSVFLLR